MKQDDYMTQFEDKFMEVQVSMVSLTLEQKNKAIQLHEKPLQALSICGKIRVTEIRKGNQL